MTWIADVEFRPSPVHGTGVFARGPIAKGTVVWRVDGATRSSDGRELAALPPRRLAYALHAGYLHRPADRFVWYEDGMQYMNHAAGSGANTGLDHWPSLPKDHTIALRNIAAGEELFEDYGFWAEVGFAVGHWLEPLYRRACPDHLAFLRRLAPELVAA